MYLALLFGLLGISFLIFFSGVKSKSKVKKYLGVVLALLTLGMFWFMDFWGEALWFESLGYSNRFWAIINSQGTLMIGGALLTFAIIYLFTLAIPKKHKIIKTVAKVIAILLGGFWGVTNWEIILKYWYGVPTGLKDPILGKDVGFYLFSLPFYDSLLQLVLILSVIAFIASFIISFIRISETNLLFFIPKEGEVIDNTVYTPVYINGAILLVVLAAERFLNRYHLMYSNTGVASGMSWTDVNIILPATMVFIPIVFFLVLTLVVPLLRTRVQNLLNKKFKIVQDRSHIFVLGATGIVVLFFWLIAFNVLPRAFNWLVVEPNEITFERPYIQHNIEFTRHGFGLDKVVEKEYPMNGELTQATLNENPNLFSNIRLWDWKALDAVYRQFQSMRLYYEFSDVDVDRYKIDGKDKQVMVSAREINLDNLPQQSQTFVNKRFQYTHGYGITMAGVSEFNQEGLPHLLIKDIPPVTEHKSLEVKQPQIYFGEMTTTPVVVNSKTKEFDHPSGEDNVYTRYSGKGGVELSSFWRKFLYGWKFDGTNFLFSDYPTEKSRLMFHRQIEERVKILAPFLHFDKDPYVVLSEGRLYWMLDAYTTSEYYPYSQPFSSTEHIPFTDGNSTNTLTNQLNSSLDGINYIRNSVKAVIDAYDGSVNFYIMDSTDPIIKVWSRIFPDLFKAKEAMPADLKNHLRYPIDMLLTQGIVYAKYHMTDPTVFYNQEDLWVRATNKYYNQVQPVEPYYIMWQQPGTKEQQFVLMLPFTPKNRQVMIGWIAGMCDADNYGNFVAYQFSKDKTVLGTQQVESKIDQDSYLSGQLSLWDQRGSRVIRGNVLAIPVNNTLFYVEPIYLQAETAAYPELRLVVVMHGDNMSYAKTFDEALSGLFSTAPVTQKVVQTTTQLEMPSQTTSNKLPDEIRTANNAFNNYLRLNSEKKFTEAARELEKLQQALQNMSKSK